MIDNILDLSVEEMKNGYSEEAGNGNYSCLICGKKYECGEVFPFEDRFFEASKAVKLHVQQEHGPMLDWLASHNKKYTGITENQKDLLHMIRDGLSDQEIAKKLGVATATIRHQRFVFREKAKQAKLYLAIFELADSAAPVKKEKIARDELVAIHPGAKMIDDRYFTTKEEEETTIRTAFSSLQPLVLKAFPAKEKKKIIVLRKICELFSPDTTYSEVAINGVLRPVYGDFATIRRYLIEYGFLQRTDDGKEYWLK